jgi:hydroxypyruvate reductase 1
MDTHRPVLFVKPEVPELDREWNTHGSSSDRRVVVTKELPGARWLEILTAAGARVEVAGGTTPLGEDELLEAIGERCDLVIGQLTERWSARALEALKAAGGSGYSNYAVGYDNVDLPAATRLGLPVGNTPGVLTHTTAECAVSLTFAAARRIVEGDAFVRAGRFEGWLPALLLGDMLWRGTVGVVGAGRIGEAYARMMVEGHRMDLVYFDVRRNEALERYVDDYAAFLQDHGEAPVACRRAADLDELLRTADVVSLHTVLDDATRHMIGARELALMKSDAIIVNTSRGPLIDEGALVEHLETHPDFRAGLDVYEREPELSPGLAERPNAVVIPHLGSATRWTREGMAVLAAQNAVAMLEGWPAYAGTDMHGFLGAEPPRAAPSIVNARELRLPTLTPGEEES